MKSTDSGGYDHKSVGNYIQVPHLNQDPSGKQGYKKYRHTLGQMSILLFQGGTLRNTVFIKISVFL